MALWLGRCYEDVRCGGWKRIWRVGGIVLMLVVVNFSMWLGSAEALPKFSVKDCYSYNRIFVDSLDGGPRSDPPSIDGGRQTGCFDIQCSGFVRTSNEVALGLPIQPVSADGGKECEIRIFIYKENHSQNCWFEWNGIPVGYWPSELFIGLQNSAKVIKFGGDVYSPRMMLKPHTTTEMGIGQFAYNYDIGACYIKPLIVDSSLGLKYPSQDSTPVRSEDYCYSRYLHADSIDQDTIFYFGGPGRNTMCN